MDWIQANTNPNKPSLQHPKTESRKKKLENPQRIHNLQRHQTHSFESHSVKNHL